MTTYFRPGDRVNVNDPLGYSGPASVVRTDRRFHDAVLVHMDSLDRAVWVLGPHVHPVEETS